MLVYRDVRRVVHLDQFGYVSDFSTRIAVWGLLKQKLQVVLMTAGHRVQM